MVATRVFLFLALFVGARAGLPPPSRGVVERYDPRWNTSVQGDFPIFTFPERKNFDSACREKCYLTVNCGAVVMKNNICTVVPEADSENTKPEVGSTFYRRIPQKDFWKTNIIKNKYTTIPPLPSTKPPPPIPQWRFVQDFNYNIGTKPATEGNMCCGVCLSPYANFIPTTATCECFNSNNYEWFPSMEIGIGDPQVCTENPAPPVGIWTPGWRYSLDDKKFNEIKKLNSGGTSLTTGDACQVCGTRTVINEQDNYIYCYEPIKPDFPGYPMFEGGRPRFKVTTCF